MLPALVSSLSVGRPHPFPRCSGLVPDVKNSNPACRAASQSQNQNADDEPTRVALAFAADLES